MRFLEFMIGEHWKVIPGFPTYLVSNMGRVFSLVSEKVLTPDYKRNDYASYALTNKNGRSSVLCHRIVYKAFCGSIPDGFEINHKDENKHNNRLDNLELVTKSQNILYNNGVYRRIETRRKNMKAQGKTWDGLEKPCMNVDTGVVYPSVKEAAIKTNGKRSSISNVCIGIRKTYRKERWIYINKEEQNESNS